MSHLAQLKVNLRPLWVPAVKALSVFSAWFEESIWKLVFTELEATIRGNHARVVESTNSPDASDVVVETERSWRDPSAAKLLSAVDKWSLDDVGPKYTFQVRWECVRDDYNHVTVNSFTPSRPYQRNWTWQTMKLNCFIRLANLPP